MKIAPGTRIGRYEVAGSLGAGGMGEVYRVIDPDLDREVALKLLPARLSEDQQSLRRFEREAKSLAALSHPNIVTIHSVEEDAGTRFMTMELIEGETLNASIRDGGMTLERFLRLSGPLTNALAAAHDRGIIHRDLKPGNVMVTPEGRVKVLDFGLAKRAVGARTGEDDPTEEIVTAAGMVLGTAPYMSPEQIEGRPIDARSDIFSLGVIFYEMLTGDRPFAGGSLATLATAILRDEPPDLSELRPDLPPRAARIVRRCLSKDPEERYGSLHELREDFRSLESEMTDGGTGRVSSSTLRTAGIAAALVALLLVVAFWIADGSGTGTPDPEAAAAIESGIDSLAVLPLTNVSGDPNQDYFAEGMTEAVINDLAKLGGLKVISRTSVARYKGTQKPLPTIAGELGVEAIVEGSVMRAGDRVRINIQLIDAASDDHLWAESYEDDVRDALSLQSRIAREIARQVKVTLSPREEQRLGGRKQVDPKAYEAYLRGRSLWSSPGGFAREKSIEYFQEAIRIDPDWAPAYAGLADVYLTMAHFVSPPHEAMPLARQNALKALALDPSLAEAHTAYADTVFHYDWDWDLAEREFRRAIELNPGYAIAHSWYAGLLAALGRHDEAAREIETAQELDPMPSAAIRGFSLRIHYWGRRVDRMLESARRFSEHGDEVDLGSELLLVWMKIALEEQQIATEDLEKLRAQTQRSPVAAVGLAAVGDRESARAALSELEQVYERRYVSPYLIAIGWAFLGEDQRALDWIEVAVEDRAADLIWINVEPAFDELRVDPRFQAVIREMGLPDREASRAAASEL